jgi:hypothetical protein
MPAIKKITLPVLFLAIIFMVANKTQAQVPDEIILSLESGNSKMLSEYFNQNVELVVLDSDNVYSKAQAKQIVTNFFNTYTPESFSILHQGGKEGARYVIGNLKTNNGSFRVYFLLKKSDGKEYIHQLRIEKK